MKLSKFLYRISSFLLAVLCFIYPLNLKTEALSQKQQEIFGNHVLYYNSDPCDTSADAGSTGTPAPATPDNKNLYLVGDSVLVGAYYTAGTDFLKSSLSSSGWKAQADANGGRGMEYPGTDPRGSLPGKAKSGIDAIKADSDAIKSSSTVVIELGTNESNVDQSASASANIFKGQMIQAINAVRNANKTANIYWVNISSNVTHPYTPYVKEYNSTIAAVAASQSISVIDTTSAGISLSPDGIHPDTAGYKKLSSTITGAIGQFASTNPPTNGADNTCCPSDGSGGTLVGNSNEEKIYNFFINQPGGLQPYQSAAIVGNIAIESAGTFRPDIAGIGVYSPTPSGAGYGLVQWTPPSSLTDVLNSAGIKGSPSDLNVQLQAIWAELTGKAGAWDERGVLRDLRNAKDVGDATAAFQGTNNGTGPPGFPSYDGFERPASESASINDRIAAARAALTKYGGGSSAGGGGASGECCPPSTTTDPSGGGSTDPSQWTKMYTGANKAKVDSLGHGKVNPQILAIHYTVGDTSGQDLLDFFVGTPEPGCGSGCGIQFNVGKDGTIYQFYPLDDMQETYEVGDANDKSIGIEITGMDVNDIINNTKQFDAVSALSKYLCDYYKMPCSEPKGKITGDGLAASQGMLGHDEIPTNDHMDPDATTAQANGTDSFSYTDSSKHPYMKKLRTALGFDPTPSSGSSGGGGGSGGGGSTGTGTGTDSCGGGGTGTGTGTDPVGSGPNQALAAEAVKYDTKANDGKYFYKWGGLHGPLSDLKSFEKNGGGTDCSGFVRYIIWKVYGHDIGGFRTQDVPSMTGIFKEIQPSDVGAGDIGWRSDHVDFITDNLGGGKLHEFGAHDAAEDLKGGDTTTSAYTKFYRYVGPGAP